ncbi:MAG: VOC family protein [Negativicutes bacterium]|nr:VOC family protein [Negativicutes bacterium]
MAKVAHLGLIVKDVERSTRFYQQYCGCQPLKALQSDLIKIQFLSAEGVIIELLQHLVPDPEAQRRAGVVDHVAFLVDDIEAEVNKLRAAGIQIYVEPRPSIIGATIIFFAGPDNERVEFIQPSKTWWTGQV